MVGIETLIRGGVYLAKLNPSKRHEVGKVRPVVVLTSQNILNSIPPIVFVCPLSSESQPQFGGLHIKIEPRDALKKVSYALVEHSKSISIERLTYPRLGHITDYEITTIVRKLQILLGC